MKRITIPGPVGKLEAAFRDVERPRAAAVLAHPHPLYGGTLDNPVVFHADRELNRAGLATLRFNFRGVGASDGFHDDGRGEIGDVAAAAGWLRARAPGVPLVLVGYSFGSRCSIAHALHDRGVAAVVAIGLPVRIWKFDDLEGLGRPFGVVQGTEDEFGGVDEVAELLSRMNPPGRLYTIAGAPHLFPARAPEAAAAVVRAVDDALQGVAAEAS